MGDISTALLNKVGCLDMATPAIKPPMEHPTTYVGKPAPLEPPNDFLPPFPPFSSYPCTILVTKYTKSST